MESAGGKTPDWRYAEACSILRRRRNGDTAYAPCFDTGVTQLADLLELMYASDVPYPHVRAKLGVVGELIGWYRSPESGGMRDLIEAAVLARASDDFYSNFISPRMEPHIRDLYCAFFFDVMDYLGNYLWVERNVFAPCKRVEDKERYTTAYIWKVVAYHGGEERLIQIALSGQMYDPGMADWFEKFSGSAHVRNVLHAVDDVSRLPCEQRAMLIYDSAREWHNRRASIHAMLEEANNSDTTAALVHSNEFGKFLHMDRSDGKLLSKEEHIDIDKYTVEDVL